MASLLLKHAVLPGSIMAAVWFANRSVDLIARLIDLAHRVLDLLRDLRDFRDGF